MSVSPKFQLLPPRSIEALPEVIRAWTQRDYDIIQVLAIRIQLITTPQAARIWWPNQTTQRNARKRLRRLAAAGLLERYIVNAHPLLKPQQPLADWRPGDRRPDCKMLSGRARRRWSQPAVPTEVFTASKLSANLFGGESHGLPTLDHRDHDLLLADAYAAHHVHNPADAARWIGEDFLPKAGFRIKDPDAFLLDDAGRPIRVIESAGRYSAKQIASFHEHCQSLALPYELW